MISAIIFDVDGTLAETEEQHRLAFNTAFEQAGLPWRWDEALYRELLQVTGGKERILHFIASRAPLPQAEAQALAPRLHAAKTAIYTEAVSAGAIPLRPGVKAFVEAAAEAGLTLAIATTTSLPNIAALLASAFGARWEQLFPVIAAGDMVPRKKPAPDVYRLALAKLGLPAEACVAIEDSRNGVASAGAAGLRVIAVRSLYTSDDDLSGAAVVLPDCRDLDLALLAELDRARV
ncbi:HAD-IA family hydrolase [Rhodopseudomonas palustris]|uniref:HAD-superfamily hydrolase subfamily IA, variant 3 n=1 Tax=Rhodopseudomonas palustris (strain BisB18) TaxID=316056 RepID=Q213J4_RHOPB